MGLDQRELFRIRATIKKETKVGSIGVEILYKDHMVCMSINNSSGIIIP